METVHEFIGRDLEPILVNQIFYSSPVGMMVLEQRSKEDFYIIAVNNAAQKMGGWRRHRPQDLLGKNILDIFDGVGEAGFFDIYNEVLNTGNRLHLENVTYEDLEVPSGIFELDIIPISKARLFISFFNVTAQVNAEHERLRQENTERAALNEALEKISAHLQKAQKAGKLGSFEVSLLNEEVFLSEQACHILDAHQWGDRIDAKTLLSERVHPDDRKSVSQFVEDAIKRAAFEPMEFRITWSDDTEHFVWVQASIEQDDMGSSIEILGVIQDITDRKALELQLMHAQKMESVGRLAAGVAHEINTPMQYVGDNTRFLSEAVKEVLEATESLQHIIEEIKQAGQVPELITKAERLLEEADLAYLAEEIPKSIEQSLEGITHVSRLVKAMKEFSHPGQEEKLPVDLNHALETTATVAKNEWKYVADIAWDLDSSLSEVLGYAGELNQVFLNILVNAAHAIGDVVGTEEKGVIRISTHADGDWAEVRIQDSGIGIPEEIRSRIFDPFFTTKLVGKGTGQGLAIAYSVVVDKHEGKISLESKVGAGTTFIIRLPMNLETSVLKE